MEHEEDPPFVQIKSQKVIGRGFEMIHIGLEVEPFVVEQVSGKAGIRTVAVDFSRTCICVTDDHVIVSCRCHIHIGNSSQQPYRLH